jgi:hypothetical protein
MALRDEAWLSRIHCTKAAHVGEGEPRLRGLVPRRGLQFQGSRSAMRGPASGPARSASQDHGSSISWFSLCDILRPGSGT